MTAKCECFRAPEQSQHRYGGITEPGGALEYNPECPEHGEQATPATGTSAEGCSVASVELSGQSGVAPDVRLLPDGRVAWIPAEVAGDLQWLSTRPAHSGRPHWPDWFGPQFFAAEDLPLADAQRLIPAGPLLELADRWAKARTMHLAHAASITDDEDEWLAEDDELLAREYGQRATELHALLVSLLGESPESPNRQEGNHD